MFKLSPSGSSVKCYGNIVTAKTAHADQRRIGYTLTIKTTIKIRHQQEDIPVYIWFVEKKGRELYEWWILNDKREAPVFISGIKKGQSLAKITKMANENSKKIVWIYIRANSKVTPLVDGIPDQYQNMIVY